MKSLLSLLGRVMLTAIFLMSAVGNKIPNFSAVANAMAEEGVPLPQLMLVGAIAFLLLGGLSLVAGYQTRIGASLLLAFLILATYFFHDFWNFTDAARQQQMISFMKNVSLMGAMTFLIANGPGAMSLDNKSKKAPT